MHFLFWHENTIFRSWWWQFYVTWRSEFFSSQAIEFFDKVLGLWSRVRIISHVYSFVNQLALTPNTLQGRWTWKHYYYTRVVQEWRYTHTLLPFSPVYPLSCRKSDHQFGSLIPQGETNQTMKCAWTSLLVRSSFKRPPFSLSLGDDSHFCHCWHIKSST